MPTESQREALRRALLLFDAVERAEALGWRTITVRRLSQLARGDDTAMPPHPNRPSTTADPEQRS